jgi:hypothetical protein
MHEPALLWAVWLSEYFVCAYVRIHKWRCRSGSSLTCAFDEGTGWNVHHWHSVGVGDHNGKDKCERNTNHDEEEENDDDENDNDNEEWVAI